MLFLNEFEDYKSVVSGLRRELKSMGIPPASHNQMLEALAKSLGHGNWAELQVAHRRRPVVKLPVPKETYDGEAVFQKEDLKYKGYRLFNDDGKLDLSVEGTFVTGMQLWTLSGTYDDILAVTSDVNEVSREQGGELDIGFAGETDVNWDGQETRKDQRGVPLWMTEDGTAIAQDRCIVAPEGFDSETNLLSEEVLEDNELRQRDSLVEAAFRWLKDTKAVSQALAEMPSGADTDFFEHEFFAYAGATFVDRTHKLSVIGEAQRAAGFLMHVGEFKELRKLLVAEQQPGLI